VKGKAEYHEKARLRATIDVLQVKQIVNELFSLNSRAIGVGQFTAEGSLRARRG